MHNEPRNENPSEPVLVAYFEKIKEKPDLQPNPEEFSNIFENDEYRKQCFDEARKAFLFIYDKEKFNGYLNADPSEEGKKYLKRVRRQGIILRAMYNFFDKSHQCPEDFHKFLSSLGEYNDTYGLETSKRENPQDVINLDNLEIPVNFTDNQDFKRYANETLSQIDELLKNPILPIEAFHDLRKRVRLCADLMQVTAAENYGGNLHWLFASMLELSTMLGEKHDQLVNKGLTGEIDYHLSMIDMADVDKSFADKFRHLEPFIKKIIGIS